MVKTEPRETSTNAVASSSSAAASTAMTAVNAAEFGERSEGGGGGQLALDEDYAEDNYDYGEYGEGEGGMYGDDSGLMDPSTGLPIPAGSDGNKGKD